MNKTKLTRISLIVLVSLFFFAQLVAPSLSSADRLTSNNYVIQFGNFNTGSGKREGTEYILSYTLGQGAAGPYGAFNGNPDNFNYFIGGGFQYIYPFTKFEFIISDIDLDLGVLYPGNHATVTNTLTISTRGAGGYTIYAYEVYPLMHRGGTDQIDDTLCDGGYTCSESEAKPWIDEDIGGFGFNAQGDTVMSDFTSVDVDCSADNVCFRQFADVSGSETMQKVMESSALASGDTGLITYKAGLSGDESAGNYETAIVYIAVPGY